MTAWGLAWRTIARSPARSVLAVAGVTVIGALLFDMLLLSRGLLVSFRDLLDAAGFDIRVIAAQGSMVHRPNRSPTRRRWPTRSRGCLRWSASPLIRTDTAQVIAPGRAGPGVRVSLVGTTEAAAGSVWTIVSGSSLPLVADARRAAAARRQPALASELHLEPGSEVRLRSFVPGTASALPLVTARVVGIGDFAFEAAGDDTVATTMEGFAAAQGAAANGDAEMVLVSSRPGAGACRGRRDRAVSGRICASSRTIRCWSSSTRMPSATSVRFRRCCRR